MKQQMEPNSAPEQQKEPVVPPPPPKSRLPLLLTFVFLVILILVGGYKLMSKSSPLPPQPTPQIPQTSPTSLPKYEIEKINDSTKRYKDLFYNFTFEFPLNMVIYMDEDTYIRNIYIQNPRKYDYQTDPEGETASINIRKIKQGETLDGLIQSIMNPQDYYEAEQIKEKIKSTQREIGVLKGYEITGLPGIFASRSFYTFFGEYLITVTVGPIEDTDITTIDKANKLYDQILSTFQFFN
ncbi:hypothetical protein HYT02_05495 [Candidatus Gottesmanbacteria bacterium]|nr:hypothetical protein [Candidatus Gottesmanbacteria bacterium]